MVADKFRAIPLSEDKSSAITSLQKLLDNQILDPCSSIEASLIEIRGFLEEPDLYIANVPDPNDSNKMINR